MRYPVTRLLYRALVRVLAGDLRASHSGEMERLLAETLEIETEKRGRRVC